MDEAKVVRSLRQALETEGPRLVVFEVGGAVSQLPGRPPGHRPERQVEQQRRAHALDVKAVRPVPFGDDGADGIGEGGDLLEEVT